MSVEKSNSWQSLVPWLQLSLLSGFGPVKARRLIAAIGHPQALFSSSLLELEEVVSKKLAHALLSLSSDVGIQRSLEFARVWLESSEAHHILTPDSPLYPQSLNTLSDAPLVLYVIGNPNLLSEPQLGVVGSRRPTPNGRRVAYEFSEKLARSGLVITSGMALGIDVAAHQGALNAYGGTVAVLGTGVDQIYPARHRDIYRSIIETGALVSEFPLGTKPFAGNFPKRNRIISGLSLGVLVVEAAVESGSLISARLAAEQGREVFAVPGSVMNPLSRGCHKLIREGAVLTESVDDILMELAPQLQPMLGGEPEMSEYDAVQEADPLRLKIIEAMGFEVSSVDQISQESGIECSELLALLTEMELDGVIESTPGGFIRLG